MDLTKRGTIDYALVLEVKQGSEAAFKELVNRNTVFIENIVKPYFKAEEDLKDAVADIWLKIYVKIGTYQPLCQFSTWACTIAKNFCYDMCRRRKLSVFSYDGHPVDFDCLFGTSVTPYAVLNSKEELKKILYYVEKLPVSWRNALLLRAEGKKYDEIAAELDISLGTVKRHIFEARQIMQQRLAA